MCESWWACNQIIPHVSQAESVIFCEPAVVPSICFSNYALASACSSYLKSFGSLVKFNWSWACPASCFSSCALLASACLSDLQSTGWSRKVWQASYCNVKEDKGLLTMHIFLLPPLGSTGAHASDAVESSSLGSSSDDAQTSPSWNNQGGLRLVFEEMFINVESKCRMLDRPYPKRCRHDQAVKK